MSRIQKLTPSHISNRQQALVEEEQDAEEKERYPESRQANPDF